MSDCAAGPLVEKHSFRDRLLERIAGHLGHHRGEIVYLERIEEFVLSQEVDHLEGDLGMMVSRSLSHRVVPF